MQPTCLEPVLFGDSSPKKSIDLSQYIISHRTYPAYHPDPTINGPQITMAVRGLVQILNNIPVQEVFAAAKAELQSLDQAARAEMLITRVETIKKTVNSSAIDAAIQLSQYNLPYYIHPNPTQTLLERYTYQDYPVCFPKNGYVSCDETLAYVKEMVYRTVFLLNLYGPMVTSRNFSRQTPCGVKNDGYEDFIGTYGLWNVSLSSRPPKSTQIGKLIQNRNQGLNSTDTKSLFSQIETVGILNPRIGIYSKVKIQALPLNVLKDIITEGE